MLERDIVQQILNKAETPEVLVITGARQAGKTTALRQINARLSSAGREVYYLTLEDPEYLRILNEHPDRLWQIIPPHTAARQIVLIDEVQYLARPASFLKYHYDLNLDKLKLIVTGSSAFYLDKHFDDSLAGRKRIFNLPTLSFQEFLGFKNRPDLAAVLAKLSPLTPDLKSTPMILSRDIISLSEEYLIYGGYPAVVLATGINEKQELLYELFTSYLKRDFLESGVNQVDKAYHLLKLLAFQTGGELNKNSLATELSINATSLDSMLTTLRATFHISLIRPFFNGHPKELRKMPKVYFSDLGMRNAILKNYSPIADRDDLGRLYENYIYRYFTDTLPRAEIQYWRTQTGSEVDLIIDSNAAYEIKWNGRHLQEAKYKKFKETYPELPLEYVVRINSPQSSILF